jgi:two-component system NarL family sensor kinase
MRGENDFPAAELSPDLWRGDWSSGDTWGVQPEKVRHPVATRVSEPNLWLALLKGAINELPDRIAIFDHTGSIILQNAAWSKRATPEDVDLSGCSGDEAYLKSYGARSVSSIIDAAKVARRLRDVIAGSRRSCSARFRPGHVARGQWSGMRAKRITEQPRLIMITHRDIDQMAGSQPHLRQLSTRLLKAQDDERRRIARELHDTTVQDLVAAKLTIERATDNDRGASDHHARLPTAISLLEKSLRDLRTLSYLMHPPMLDELGLVPAVRWYVKGFGERTGIPVMLETRPMATRVPADIESALFRIAQEALTNVYRHSGSKIATVSLMRQRSTIVLEVKDRGKGMPSALLHGSRRTLLGVGIPGMRARAEQYGGSLTIHSTKRGTQVRAAFPLSSLAHCDVAIGDGAKM